MYLYDNVEGNFVLHHFRQIIYLLLLSLILLLLKFRNIIIHFSSRSSNYKSKTLIDSFRLLTQVEFRIDKWTCDMTLNYIFLVSLL